MLDTGVDRIRVDRLREFLEERKREAEADRLEALDRDLSNAVSESTGAIEAYEAVLSYVDAKSTDRGLRGGVVLRRREVHGSRPTRRCCPTSTRSPRIEGRHSGGSATGGRSDLAPRTDL